MAKEIERKFLAYPEKLPQLNAPVFIIQGYLCRENPTIRVRIRYKTLSAPDAFIAVKYGSGLIRDEFEYEIPVNDAKGLIKKTPFTIEKDRYAIGKWEIDHYLGRLKTPNIWIAEYELKSRTSRIPKFPEWLGRDITTDVNYSSSNLVCW